MPRAEIIEKYGDRLMLREDEFREYAKGRSHMTVIEFENFEKFKNPVKPKRFVTVAGKYIDEEEFKIITESKD